MINRSCSSNKPNTATKRNQFQEPIWGSHSNAKQQVSTVFDGHNLERVPIFWIDSLDGHLYPYLLLVKSPFLDVNLEAVEMFTYWLVVWNIWIIFPYIGIIIPTDFHIFQRGWNHQPDYHHIIILSHNSPYYHIYPILAVEMFTYKWCVIFMVHLDDCMTQRPRLGSRFGESRSLTPNVALGERGSGHSEVQWRGHWPTENRETEKKKWNHPKIGCTVLVSY